MKVCGEIIKIKNEIAYIRTARPASCEGCANAGLCSKESVEITALNQAGGRVGDLVEVEADEARSSLWVISYIFLVPVIILFAGIFLFSIFPWLALACVPLTASYFFILKRLNSVWTPTNIVVNIKDK